MQHEPDFFHIFTHRMRRIIGHFYCFVKINMSTLLLFGFKGLYFFSRGKYLWEFLVLQKKKKATNTQSGLFWNAKCFGGKTKSHYSTNSELYGADTNLSEVPEWFIPICQVTERPKVKSRTTLSWTQAPLTLHKGISGSAGCMLCLPAANKT